MEHKNLEFPEVHVGAALFKDVTVVVSSALTERGNVGYVADVFKDKSLAREVITRVQQTLLEQLETVNKQLDDPEVGAVTIVTPFPENGDAETAFIRMVTLMACTDATDNPLADDRLNKTPFTLYGASDENKQAMADAGLRNFAPDAVLGYHNDGAFAENAIYVPERVGLQNVVLNYKKPGNFYWLPFAMWQEGEELLQTLENQKLQISTTPIAHREKGTGEVIVDRELVLSAPAIWRTDTGLPCLFLNGEPVPESDALFRSLQKSLARNTTRWASAQALNRLTLIRNDRGVHARDILQEPIASGAQASRMMCRTISSKGEVVPN